jgi:hypothetical protein
MKEPLEVSLRNTHKKKYPRVNEHSRRKLFNTLHDDRIRVGGKYSGLSLDIH